MSRFLSIVDHNGRPIPKVSAYEGATTGRRLFTYGLSSTGPNAELYGSLATLRSRSRQFGRDNPLIDSAFDTWAANLVGTGITPKWDTGDKGLDKAIRELWDESVSEMDADGVFDFYGMQALAVRSMVESGEVFANFQHRRKTAPLMVPFQVQLIEADHLDASDTKEISGDRRMIMGIEFWGNIRKKYHFFKEHPGELNWTSDKTEIPAYNVAHIYRPLRPGQKRGRPWMSSIILMMHELDQLDDADLVRRKVQCMFGGFLKKNIAEPTPDLLGTSDGTDEKDVPITAMEPGTFPELPPGYEVDFVTPPQGDGGVDFHKALLKKAARGMGLTYDQFSGDLKEVNFTSLRSGLSEVRRFMKMIQAQTVIYQFCRPVGIAWLKSAVFSGRINIRGFADNPRKYLKCKWSPDAWDYIKPSEDIETDKKRVRSGFASIQQIREERNIDSDRTDREIAEYNTVMDSEGFVFDTDPRQTSNSGQTQKDYSNE